MKETRSQEPEVRSQNKNFLFCLLASAFWLLTSSCSKYVPVEGKVVLDGQPADQTTVAFIPVGESGGSKMAQTFTDPDGRFQLYTVRRPGALPGKYKVTLTRKVPPPSVPPPKDFSMAEAMRINIQKLETIPRSYTDQATTPLELEIPKGGSKDLLIEVTSATK